MFINTVNECEYIERMENLSRMLDLYYATINSDTYRLGAKIKGRIKKLKNFPDEIILRMKLDKNEPLVHTYEQPNYFSNEKIAVYTCFFGRYDSLEDPICYPNNIDYYVITDQPVSETSRWKKLNIAQYEETLKNFSNVERNRWYKMFPHKVFKDYRFSIYIDGNVVPVTDFTEFINKVGNSGIAMFNHSTNDCIYQEALYNKYRIKKITSKEVDKQVAYLRAKGMPEHYGMTTCNVIARDHENLICRKMMDDWWYEFMNGCKRDQLSFPYVAWCNHIDMDDIAVLGADSWSSRSFYVKRHIR